jgi:hypothetical protein
LAQLVRDTVSAARAAVGFTCRNAPAAHCSEPSPPQTNNHGRLSGNVSGCVNSPDCQNSISSARLAFQSARISSLMRSSSPSRRRRAGVGRRMQHGGPTARYIDRVLPRACSPAGTARPHLLRISGARKSVVAVTGELRPAQCPLRADSDQILQRNKMTRYANTGHNSAAQVDSSP